MKKTLLITLIIIFSLANITLADITICQSINDRGYMKTASAMTTAMNRRIELLGMNHTVSTKEMNNTICSFCTNNPQAGANEITQLLENILNIMLKSGI